MDLDLSGRHALVCGASEGIGLAAARTRPARRRRHLARAPRGRAARRPRWLAAARRPTPRLRRRRRGADRCAGEAAERTRFATSGASSSTTPAARPRTWRMRRRFPAYLDAFTRHLVANQTCCRPCCRGMRGAGWGRIVNVISTSVYEPIANLGVSNTIRGAVAKLGEDAVEGTRRRRHHRQQRAARLHRDRASRADRAGRDGAQRNKPGSRGARRNWRRTCRCGASRSQAKSARSSSSPSSRSRSMAGGCTRSESCRQVTTSRSTIRCQSEDGGRMQISIDDKSILDSCSVFPWMRIAQGIPGCVL